jgi:hypothetical protein
MASVGLAEALLILSEPGEAYQWRNGQGETLQRLPFDDTNYSGWPTVSLFTQPPMEAALDVLIGDVG